MNSIIKAIYGKFIYSKYANEKNLNLILPDLDNELNEYALSNCVKVVKKNNFEDVYIFVAENNKENIEDILKSQNLEYKLIVLKEKDIECLICFYLLKCKTTGKCNIKSLRLVSLTKNYIEFKEVCQYIKMSKKDMVNEIMNRFEF